MKKVAHILDQKGREVWTVPPDHTVFDALQLLAEKDVGALVVADGSRVLGIFSERDYARRVILMGRRSHESRVEEVMTPDPIAISPESTVRDCMTLMTLNRVRHLPVVAGDALVGMVTIGDVVKAVIEEQGVVIDQLERYIRGR
jgi:CBS domain-containing protein